MRRTKISIKNITIINYEINRWTRVFNFKNISQASTLQSIEPTRVKFTCWTLTAPTWVRTSPWAVWWGATAFSAPFTGGLLTGNRGSAWKYPTPIKVCESFFLLDCWQEKKSCFYMWNYSQTYILKFVLNDLLFS